LIESELLIITNTYTPLRIYIPSQLPFTVLPQHVE